MTSDELAYGPDRFLGSWELLERMGEGATAVVWRARHTTLGHLAAVKVAEIAIKREPLCFEHRLQATRELQPVRAGVGQEHAGRRWIAH